MQGLKTKAKKIYEGILKSTFPIPFFDAYSITDTQKSCGIAMLMFSTIYNRNEISFGILIALGGDLELKYHSSRCLEIIKNSPLQDNILSHYPNWGMNYGMSAIVLNEDILVRAKYINFKTSHIFKTPTFNDFNTGYNNILEKYPDEMVNLIGYPDIDGIQSSLLFINDEIIKYHNNKVIGLTDSYGLAKFIERNEVELKKWAKRISFEHAITEPLIVDFIWAGGDIKPYGSVADIEKFMAVYFIGYYTPSNKKVTWREPVFSVSEKRLRIYDIRAIKQYRFILDTNKDKEQDNITLFRSFTKEIEINCPVGSYFNKPNRSGIGVVWHVEFNDRMKYYFLIKTNNTLNKTPTSEAKLKSFIDYVMTQNRLEKVSDSIGGVKPKNLSSFITELYSDILASEDSYIKNNAFDMEDLEQAIWTFGAKWYRTQYFLP